jgi:copper(I)-binding protein
MAPLASSFSDSSMSPLWSLRSRFPHAALAACSSLAACAGLALSGTPAPALDAATPAFKAGPLTIIAPWARATPKGATTAAAYLTIVNSGDEPDRLTGASTAVAAQTTPHEMTMTNGVMAMRSLPEVAIPAHGRATLGPGSIHLMLEHLARPLKAGESFTGTLTFARAGAVPVTFTVAPIGARGPASGM